MCMKMMMMMMAVLTSVFRIDQVNINSSNYIIFLCGKLIGVFSSMYIVFVHSLAQTQ